MSETLKLTAEELQKAREIQTVISNLTFQIGEITIRQQNAVRQLNQVREAQAQFNQEIDAKYPGIAFDITTGDAVQPEPIIPTEASTEEAQ